MSQQVRGSARPAWLLAVALVVMGLNLRAAITSVAAVLPQMRVELQLDATTAALLTSLPVLAFAAMSAPTATVARRFGVDRSMIVAGLALGLFTLIRPFTPLAGLLLATMFIGIAITVGNVLVPVVVRRDFADHRGPMTSLTVGAITGGAALVAALTAPIATVVGWRWSLAVWGLTALAATAIYALAAPHKPVQPEPQTTRSGWVWRRPAAWALAGYFALQASCFYAATAWLPTILPAVAGVSDAVGATATAVFHFAGSTGALTIPVILTRSRSRRMVTVLVSAGWLALSLGLILAPSMMWLWLAIGGFSQGGTFALVMALMTIRAADATAVRDLSAMVQSLGYAAAALAPILIGWLLDGVGPGAALNLTLGMSIGMVGMAVIIGSRKPI
ncbi:MAG: CynX/NimT family MFS transporter [Beutenbergiaceae bacterium]